MAAARGHSWPGRPHVLCCPVTTPCLFGPNEPLDSPNVQRAGLADANWRVVQLACCPGTRVEARWCGTSEQTNGKTQTEGGHVRLLSPASPRAPHIGGVRRGGTSAWPPLAVIPAGCLALLGTCARWSRPRPPCRTRCAVPCKWARGAHTPWPGATATPHTHRTRTAHVWPTSLPDAARTRAARARPRSPCRARCFLVAWHHTRTRTRIARAHDQRRALAAPARCAPFVT